VTQVAKNRFTSDRYHDFIGFEISKPVLERAFQDTYNVPLSDVISDEDLAFGTFRRAISQVIPEMTRVALVARRKEIVAETPNLRARQFRYYLSRTSYQKEWGKGYRRPGFGTRVLAFFLRLVPKVGPFKAVDFKIPTQQTEDLYVASVDRTVENYTKLLQEAAAGRVQLTNTDFDTGRDTHAGENVLTDDTYAHLLDQLAGHNFDQITPELRTNVLGFYSDPNAPIATRKKPEAWKKTLDELQKLRALPDPPGGESKATSKIRPEGARGLLNSLGKIPHLVAFGRERLPHARGDQSVLEHFKPHLRVGRAVNSQLEDNLARELHTPQSASRDDFMIGHR
jgi:hypothetical protein